MKVVRKIRVLITTSFPIVSYSIIRSIKPYCDYIAGLTYEKGIKGINKSKYLDELHYILPMENFIGKASRDDLLNTLPSEKEFVAGLLKICIKNNISLIIPTSEFEILILSKNKDKFEEFNITVATSSFQSLIKSMDKFEVIKEAKKIGLPCPETILPKNFKEVEEFSEMYKFPIVVKVRFSNNSNGVKLANNLKELYEIINNLLPLSGWPALQEYIPGTKEPSVHTILDENLNMKLLFTLRKHRYLASGYSTCIQTTSKLPETEKIISLIQSLELVGYSGIQMKLDERDGKHKLIEINPRWGSNSRIHLRLGLKFGINAVLKDIQAYLGEQQRFEEYPENVLGISIVEDILALRTFLKKNKNDTNIALPYKNIIKSYINSYIFRKSTFDFIWCSILDDPKIAYDVYKGITKEYKNSQRDFLSWGDLIP